MYVIFNVTQCRPVAVSKNEATANRMAADMTRDSATCNSTPSTYSVKFVNILD